jgi:hypothetical protein
MIVHMTKKVHWPKIRESGKILCGKEAWPSSRREGAKGAHNPGLIYMFEGDILANTQTLHKVMAAFAKSKSLPSELCALPDFPNDLRGVDDVVVLKISSDARTNNWRPASGKNELLGHGLEKIVVEKINYVCTPDSIDISFVTDITPQGNQGLDVADGSY